MHDISLHFITRPDITCHNIALQYIITFDYDTSQHSTNYEIHYSSQPFGRFCVVLLFNQGLRGFTGSRHSICFQTGHTCMTDLTYMTCPHDIHTYLHDVTRPVCFCLHCQSSSTTFMISEYVCYFRVGKTPNRRGT